MRFVCIILAQLLCFATVLGEESPEEPVELLLAATFRITDKETSGTGFLVTGPPGTEGAGNSVWVVTAAHTWEGMPGDKCTLILRETNEVRLVRREVSLKIRSGVKPIWTKHPSLDLAVIRLDLPAGVACKPIPFQNLARTEEFRSGKIRLGAAAWVFTFPVQLEANSAGLPVLRRGYVSSLPAGEEGDERTFLVDFSTFGGDSGAPVLVESGPGIEKRWLLAGLVQGMHRQTDKFKLPFQETTLHYPLGLGIVLPAPFIRQTIEAALKE